MLLALLRCGTFDVTGSLPGVFRATARSLGVDRLHASAKVECHSGRGDMVDRKVERPDSGGVPLPLHRSTSVGCGQCVAAAGAEIELLCISGGSFVRFRFARVLIRLFPVLSLAVEMSGSDNCAISICLEPS